MSNAIAHEPTETLADIKACSIPLPVQPKDQSRIDEKYSLRGYNSLDARCGCDWGATDERM
jgi:hypothetical protein